MAIGEIQWTGGKRQGLTLAT